MFSKFARNGVIVGQLDSFCLMCGCYLRDGDSVNSHIAKQVHISNLKSIGYFEKYKDDHIMKVKNGYFCEFCNLLLPTAAQAGLHIAESTHKENKGAFLLKRSGHYVTAFDRLLISEDAWHGLTEDTCLICTTEFEAKDIHKTEHQHILKLIQTKVMFKEPNVYRKIDENSLLCLTCNNVFSTNSFDEHFDSDDHDTASKKCESDYKEHNSKCKDAISNTPEVVKLVEPKQDENPKVNMREVKPLDDKINKPVKETTNTDVKLEEKRKTVNAATKGDETPIEPKKKDTKVANTPKSVEELDKVYLEALGSNGYVIHLEMENFCVICNSPVVESIDLHLLTRHHQALYKLHKARAQKYLEQKESEHVKNEIQQFETVEKPKQKVVEEKHNESFDKNAENTTKILEAVVRFQNAEVNIDFINEAAFCKKCAVPVDFEYEAIDKHIKKHNKTNNKENKKNKVRLESGTEANGGNKSLFTKPVLMEQAEASSDENIEKIVKENNMSFRDRKLFCDLCGVVVPPKVKSIQEHISGSGHKSKITQAIVKKEAKDSIKKVQINLFIDKLTAFEMNGLKLVIINEKICMSCDSLIFLHVNAYRIMCLGCEERLDPNSAMHHLTGQLHRQRFEESQVVVTSATETEFVREIKHDVYHCGICNHVENGWASMSEHLNGFVHTSNKTASESRLREYVHNNSAQRTRTAMDFVNLMGAFMQSNFNRPNRDSSLDRDIN